MSRKTLRALLDGDDFIVAGELVTSRGVLSDRSTQEALAMGRELVADGRFDLLSLTDNPAGSAMLAPETLGAELHAAGQELNIHLACKDANRNGLKTRAWQLASQGFHNILALSGDAPIAGYRGAASSVFDIDAVGLLAMLDEMNRGMVLEGPRPEELQPTRFVLSCAMTNHKRLENEVMPQYFKLRKKVENGAELVLPQIGYNARKDDELLRWMRHDGCSVPVLANVYILSAPVARVFNAERVPGVVVSDALLERCEHEARSPDKGKGFFLDLAARQVAIARGLGFKGVYIGGHVPAADYRAVLDLAAAFGEDDWRELAGAVAYGQPGEFYFFERDPETGLSSDEVNAAYLASRRTGRLAGRARHPRYAFSRLMHNAVFDERGPLHRPAKAVVKAADGGPKPVGRALHMFEQANKVPLFHCKDCGDCSLPDIAYLCPESQCAKNQRNGPCGGTRSGGRCEVYDFECIWARAYDRLKPYGEEERMLDGPAVIKNAALQGTSAWANTFLARDHHARERALGPAEKPEG